MSVLNTDSTIKVSIPFANRPVYIVEGELDALVLRQLLSQLGLAEQSTIFVCTI